MVWKIGRFGNGDAVQRRDRLEAAGNRPRNEVKITDHLNRVTSLQFKLKLAVLLAAPCDVLEDAWQLVRHSLCIAGYREVIASPQMPRRKAPVVGVLRD
ncbi:MAG: hypothetical protein QOF51_4130 [Chloroflexota bacterium]|jgi:hypothetical protein|nr:hypothetical protein [Chloroflexota bacterium]